VELDAPAPLRLQPDRSRADLYDEVVFKRATFATLLQQSRGRPYVLLNATDMTLGARFEFTQDQFDLLCSDLSQVPVARAVAASSAFPILLSHSLFTTTGRSLRSGSIRPPAWLRVPPSLQSPRRQALARNLMSYRQDLRDRPFVHLLDGGSPTHRPARPYIALSDRQRVERLQQDQ